MSGTKYTFSQIIGVKRNPIYSLNHINNDAAIFYLTVNHLQKKGCKVIIFSETELQSYPIYTDLIFTMARHSQSIQQLKKLENLGKKVVNSGYGIENCTRKNVTKLLVTNKIPFPQSIIISTNNYSLSKINDTLGSYCWIKRGDFHSLQEEDVSYVHIKEAENIINKYALRGIKSAIINEHLHGDLIKFYGVYKTDFFYWFYPDMSHSKLGLEKINGKAIGIPFDHIFLKTMCTHISELLNVPIYGGDCIVTTNGIIKIIDFNDWPSFAPCRQNAAFYIAEYIFNQLL